jgi:toxin ParE1/3/4
MAHRLAPQAEAALDAIWSHGAEASGSIESADRLIDSITARFLLLADNPFLGRARDDLRSFQVGEYVIIYRIADGKDAVILHAVRGSRDIERAFGR